MAVKTISVALEPALPTTPKMGRTSIRRKYSDREKAEALAIYDACGSLSETSRATGIPDATVSDWINNKRA